MARKHTLVSDNMQHLCYLYVLAHRQIERKKDSERTTYFTLDNSNIMQ